MCSILGSLAPLNSGVNSWGFSSVFGVFMWQECSWDVLLIDIKVNSLIKGTLPLERCITNHGDV